MNLSQHLSDEDKVRLQAQRKWVREHFTPQTEHKYDELDEKIRLIQTILNQKWIKPDETVKLQCLGVALGDAIAQKTGMAWRSIRTDEGRDLGLQFKETSLVVWPITMISKRIERGEDEVNVRHIFDLVCSKVDEVKDQVD